MRQSIETPFVHDTLDNQRRGWGDVQGKIAFDDANVEGAEIELLDERGNVVQRVRSTKSGQYRFKNAKAKKKYKVRVKRKGFRHMEQDVAPAAAAEAPEQKADFSLQAE